MAAGMVISSWFIVHRLKLITFFLSFLLFTFSFFLLSKPSFAQTTAAPAAATNYEQRTNLSTSQLLPSSPNYATMAIYNFGHAISCILIGQSPISPCLEYRMYKDAQGMIRSAPYLSNVNTSNGVLGVTLSMIGEVISTPPIRSSEYFLPGNDRNIYYSRPYGYVPPEVKPPNSSFGSASPPRPSNRPSHDHL